MAVLDHLQGGREASVRIVLLGALLAGCAMPESYPSREAAYWDQPTTGWYWVADGIEPAAIIESAGDCGAKLDGSVANHGLVPPGFSVHVFTFVGQNSETVRECTVKRLGAVPQLTIYLRSGR
jgi:hypothetical protein